MSERSVLNRFPGLRAILNKPNRWKAKCRIHKGGEERNPSLYLWLNDRGHLMGKCLACGARLPAQLQEMGIDMAELSDKQKADAKQAAEDEAYARRKIAAEYVYHSMSGVPLYRVLRWQPKAFHQERWDVMTGKWLPGLGQVERVPYKLPELLAKPDFPVIIVEGEKDVERLMALGLVATCNVGGVGMGWHDDYSTHLIGRRVAVIPDNDAPGLRHAYSVVGSLIAHHVASVRLVHLPLGWKDVSDYLDAGHGRDDLQALLRAKMYWEPSDKDFEASRLFMQERAKAVAA